MAIDVAYESNPVFAQRQSEEGQIVRGEALTAAPNSEASQRALGVTAGRNTIPNIDGWRDDMGHPSVSGWPGETVRKAFEARQRAAATQEWIRGELGA